MLNYWFSSYDGFCPDIYNYSWFKLMDKCRSEKWELYLFGDMTIKVDRDFVEVLPRGVPRLGSSPYLATGHTPSLSCACLLSVACHEHASGSSSLEWEVQRDVRVHGSSCGTCCDVLHSHWQEAPSMLLQQSCPRALRRQTALTLRLQCAARVLVSPCRVMVEVSLLMVLFMA